jgi:hypothetical protein
MALRLAQMFDVSGQFVPTKASLYLKRIGVNVADYFDLDSGSVPIDATNFNEISQGSNKMVIDDRVALFTNNGYMRAQSVSGSDWSILSYNVKATIPAKFYLYLRSYSSSGTFTASILIDGEVVQSISVAALAAWQWIATDFVLPDDQVHILGIRLEENNLLLDKLDIETVAAVPAGTGPAIALSPFVTVHLQVYDVKNLKPNDPLFIYDWKTTISEIHIDDWYNFSLSLLDGSSLTFDETYALVVSSSGGSTENYVMWELVDNDEYLLLPSSIKV